MHRQAAFGDIRQVGKIVRVGLAVLYRQHKAEARFFDIVGGDFAFKFIGLAGDKFCQRGMRIRNLILRDQPFVIDKHHRLIGSAIGFLLPDRPVG